MRRVDCRWAGWSFLSCVRRLVKKFLASQVQTRGAHCARQKPPPHSGLLEQIDAREAADHAVFEIIVVWRRPGCRGRSVASLIRTEWMED